MSAAYWNVLMRTSALLPDTPRKLMLSRTSPAPAISSGSTSYRQHFL